MNRSAKKGFTLLEIMVSLMVMGLTVTALLNVLEWSNQRYHSVSTDWKERSCFTEARYWIRNQIVLNNNNEITLNDLTKSVKCPDGFGYNELTVTKHDSETYFVKLGIYEDRNRNGVADQNEITGRLFCFRRRQA